MDSSSRLQIATLISIVFVVLVGIGNLMAVDRLERQVIRVAQDVEQIKASGGGSGSVVRVQSAGSADVGEPGSSTGFTAIGWGNESAEITVVEGHTGDAYRLQDKPKPQGDHYVSRRNEPPGSLNMYTTNEGDARTVSKYVLDKLMEPNFDDPTEVLPQLAVAWERSDDDLVYTYTLREGVQFADGRPFSSADVKFSFDVMRDPGVNAEHMRGGFEDVVSLEAPDAYTVVVKYRQKYWKGLYKVGTELPILNKGWFEDNIPRYAEKLGVETYATEPGKPGFGDVFNKIRSLSPGTGAYYYPAEDYEPEKGVELVQNPFYWGIQVYPTWHNFAKYRWVYISDKVAAFEEFRKEKFDVTVVDFQDWDDELINDETVTGISDYYEYDHTGLAYSFLAWNTREPPLDDPKVRYALAHLVDRSWIKQEIERGRGSIATCPSKRTYSQYNNDLDPIPFDPAKARALLEEAGWSDTDGDGILDKDGQRFELEIKYGSARRFYTQVTASVVDAAKKAGVRISTRQLEWATFVEDFYERRFDGVILYNSFPDSWVDSYNDFHSSQDVPRGENHSGWNNPKVDSLLEGMRVEFDKDARDEDYQEFCEVFQQEQPYTLLVHGVVGVLIHDRIEDVKISKRGMQPHEFWVKPENRLHQ